MIRKALEALLRGGRPAAVDRTAWNERLNRIAEDRPGESPQERSARIEQELQQPRPLPPPRVFRNIADYRSEHGGGSGRVVTVSPPPLWGYSASSDGGVPLSSEPIRSASGDLELSVREDGEDLVVSIVADYGVFVQGKRATAAYSLRNDLLLVLGNHAVNDGLSNIVIELSFDRRGSSVVRVPNDPLIKRLLHSFTIETRDGGGP